MVGGEVSCGSSTACLRARRSPASTARAASSTSTPCGTLGSRLARHGVGLVQEQRLMGHSDPKLTAQVYTQLDVEDLRRAVEVV